MGHHLLLDRGQFTIVAVVVDIVDVGQRKHRDLVFSPADQIAIPARLLLHIIFDAKSPALSVFGGPGEDDENPRPALRCPVVLHALQPARLPDVVEPVFELAVGVLGLELLPAHRLRHVATIIDLFVEARRVRVAVGRHDHEHRPLGGEEAVGVVVDLLAAEVPDMDGRRHGTARRHMELVEADVGGRALVLARTEIRVLWLRPPLLTDRLPGQSLGNGRLAAAAAAEEEDLRHQELDRRIFGEPSERAELAGDVSRPPLHRCRPGDDGCPLAAVDAADIEAAKGRHLLAAGGVERAHAVGTIPGLADRQRQHFLERRAAAEIEMVKPAIALQIGQLPQLRAAAEDEFLEPAGRKTRIADRRPAGGERGRLTREPNRSHPRAIDERQFLERVAVLEDVVERMRIASVDRLAPVEVHPAEACRMKARHALERSTPAEIKTLEVRKRGRRERLQLRTVPQIEADERLWQAGDPLEIGEPPENEMGEVGEAAEVEPGMTAGLEMI